MGDAVALDRKPNAPVRGETVLAQSPLLLTLVCVGCGAVLGALVPLLAQWMVTLRCAVQGPRGTADVGPGAPAHAGRDRGGRAAGAGRGLPGGARVARGADQRRSDRPDNRGRLTAVRREMWPRRTVTASSSCCWRRTAPNSPAGPATCPGPASPRRSPPTATAGSRRTRTARHGAAGSRHARPAEGRGRGAGGPRGALKRDDADDARELAEELRRLGVTVRTNKNRQY